MLVDTEELFLEAVKTGLRDAVKAKLQYAKLIDELLGSSRVKAVGQELVDAAFDSMATDKEFRALLIAELKQSLAKTLVRRFGGEIEATVNRLKSDPVTRARIVLALEQCVK